MPSEEKDGIMKSIKGSQDATVQHIQVNCSYS